MPVKRRNRGIMGVAIVLGAMFVALDHSQYRRSLPAPVAGESEPQVEAGGYGSASDDADASLITGPGAETGGYGAAGDDADTPTGPETGGYGVAAGAGPDEAGQGAAATTTPDEDVSRDMEEYYRRLQLDSETDNAR
jgi:hypothetical protein